MEDTENEASSTDAERSSENEPPEHQQQVDRTQEDEEEAESDSGETHDSMPELELVDCQKIAAEILRETQEEAKNSKPQPKTAAKKKSERKKVQAAKASSVKQPEPATAESVTSSPKSATPEESDPENSTDDDMPGLSPTVIKDAPKFKVGDMVELFGLNNRSYNGLRGKIAKVPDDSGQRYDVHFLDTKDVPQNRESALLKPENLRLFLSTSKSVKKEVEKKPQKAQQQEPPRMAKKVDLDTSAALKQKEERLKKEEQARKNKTASSPKRKEVVQNDPIKPVIQKKPGALTFDGAEEKAYYHVFGDLQYLKDVFSSIGARIPRVKLVGDELQTAYVENKFPKSQLLELRVHAMKFKAPPFILQRGKVSIKAGRGLVPNISSSSNKNERESSMAPDSPSSEKQEKKKKKKDKKKKKKEKEEKRRKKEEERQRKEAEAKAKRKQPQLPPYTFKFDLESLYEKYLLKKEAKEMENLNTAQLRYAVWKVCTQIIGKPKMWDKFNTATESYAAHPTLQMREKLSKAFKGMAKKRGDTRMSPEKKAYLEDYDRRVAEEKQLIRRDQERGNEKVGTCSYARPQKYGLDAECDKSVTRTVRKTHKHFKYECVTALTISGAVDHGKVNGRYTLRENYGFRNQPWSLVHDHGDFEIARHNGRWSILTSSKSKKKQEVVYWSSDNGSYLVPPTHKNAWIAVSYKEENSSASNSRRRKKKKKAGKNSKSSGMKISTSLTFGISGCKNYYHQCCWENKVYPSALEKLQKEHSEVKAFKIGDRCICSYDAGCAGYVLSLTDNINDHINKFKPCVVEYDEKNDQVVDDTEEPDINLMQPPAMLYVLKYYKEKEDDLRKKGRKNPEKQAKDHFLRKWHALGKGSEARDKWNTLFGKRKRRFDKQVKRYKEHRPDYVYVQPEEFDYFIQKGEHPGVRVKKPASDMLPAGSKKQLRQFQHKQKQFEEEEQQRKKEELAHHDMVKDFFEDGAIEAGKTLVKKEAAAEYIVSFRGKKVKKKKKKKAQKSKSLALFNAVRETNEIDFVENDTLHVFFAGTQTEDVAGDLQTLSKHLSAAGVRSEVESEFIQMRIPKMNNLHGILVTFPETRYAKQYATILRQEDHFKIVEMVVLGMKESEEGYMVPQNAEPIRQKQDSAPPVDAIARILANLTESSTDGFVRQDDLNIGDENLKTRSLIVCVASTQTVLVKRFPTIRIKHNVKQINNSADIKEKLGQPNMCADIHPKRPGCIRVNISNLPTPIDFDSLFSELFMLLMEYGEEGYVIECMFPGSNADDLEVLDNTFQFFPGLEARKVKVETNKYTADNYDITGEHRIVQFPSYDEAATFKQNLAQSKEKQIFQVHFIPDEIGDLFIQHGESVHYAPEPVPPQLEIPSELQNMDELQKAPDFNIDGLSPKEQQEQIELMRQFEGRQNETRPDEAYSEFHQAPEQHQREFHSPAPNQRAERSDYDSSSEKGRQRQEQIRAIRSLRERYGGDSGRAASSEFHQSDGSSFIARSRSPHPSTPSSRPVRSSRAPNPSPIPAAKPSDLPMPPPIVRDSYQKDFPNGTPYQKPSSSSRNTRSSEPPVASAHLKQQGETHSRYANQRSRDDVGTDDRREYARRDWQQAAPGRNAHYDSDRNNNESSKNDQRAAAPGYRNADHESDRARSGFSKRRRPNEDEHVASRERNHRIEPQRKYDGERRNRRIQYQEDRVAHNNERSYNRQYEERHQEEDYTGETSHHTGSNEGRDRWETSNHSYSNRESNRESFREDNVSDDDSDSSDSSAPNIRKQQHMRNPSPKDLPSTPVYKPPHKRAAAQQEKTYNASSPRRFPQPSRRFPDNCDPPSRKPEIKPRPPPYPKDPDSFQNQDSNDQFEKPADDSSDSSDSESTSGPIVGRRQRAVVREPVMEPEGFVTGDTPGGGVSPRGSHTSPGPSSPLPPERKPPPTRNPAASYSSVQQKTHSSFSRDSYPSPPRARANESYPSHPRAKRSYPSYSSQEGRSEENRHSSTENQYKPNPGDRYSRNARAVSSSESVEPVRAKPSQRARRRTRFTPPRASPDRGETFQQRSAPDRGETFQQRSAPDRGETFQQRSAPGRGETFQQRPARARARGRARGTRPPSSRGRGRGGSILPASPSGRGRGRPRGRGNARGRRPQRGRGKRGM